MEVYKYGFGTASREKKRDGYFSPSFYWKSRIKETFKPMVETDNSRLQKALHQLARTANLVENGSTSERNLSIAWSNGGSSNTPDSLVIFLNPKDITGSSPSSDDANIDALTGKTLTLSSMKKTMSVKSYRAYSRDKSPSKVNASSIWMARETFRAKNAVIKDWNGFLPYFDLYDSRMMDSHESKIAELATSEVNEKSFTEVLAWNIVSPSRAVAFSGKTDQEFLSEMISMISANQDADKEYRVASAVAKLINKRYAKDSEEESQDSEIPQFLDQELFGSDILGDGTERKPLSFSDDSLRSGNPFNPNDYVKPEQNQEPELYEVGLYQSKVDYSADYSSLCNKLRGQISSIRKILSFRNTEQSKWSHAKEEGDLDEGALHKIRQSNATIWSQRTSVSKPSVAIGLLIDESGSMAYDDKIDDARDVAIVITEAIKDMSGVDLAVFGHTGEVGRMDSGSYPQGASWEDFAKFQNLTTVREGEQLVIREFFASRHFKNSHGLVNISAIAENLDGYAIEAAAKRLKQLYPHATNHVILHISDGEPSYRMIKHTRKSVDKCVQQLKVEVYAIGVCDAYSESRGEELYGPGRNVVIKDVLSSLPILASFLKRHLARL